MKFSVVMPVWNGADYLANSVGSLQRQNHCDWELIIVNDGSTDDTRERAEALAKNDSRIRVVSQPNGGVSTARNRGMSEASGEWIYWLDVDDSLSPDTLKTFADIIEANPGIQCIQSPYLEIQPDGGKRPIIPPAYEHFGDKCLSGQQAFQTLFADLSTRGQNWQPWRFTFASTCLPHFREGVIHEDVDVLPLHLASLQKVFISRTPLYEYLPAREGASTAQLSSKRVRDILDVTAHVYGELEKCALLSDEAKRGFRGNLAFNLFGYFLATKHFPTSEKNVLLLEFQKHKEWLLAIDAPRKTAWIKRLALQLLGVRGTVAFFGR